MQIYFRKTKRQSNKLNDMYCKSCGKEIDDDSKFCSYCGAKQQVISQTAEVIHDEGILDSLDNDYSMKKEKITHSETKDILQNENHEVKFEIPRISEEKANSYFYKLLGFTPSKKVKGAYLLYFAVNLIAYLIEFDRDYDFRMFLLFVTLPVLLTAGINYFRLPYEERVLIYDYKSKRSFSATYWGIALIVFQIFIYFVSYKAKVEEVKKAENRYSYGSYYSRNNDKSKWELENELEELENTLKVMSTILKFIFAVVLYSIAKGLNRKPGWWSFFGFCFPAIALVVIGTQRRRLTDQEIADLTPSVN